MSGIGSGGWSNLAKWHARWRAHGENGLLDHSSRPATCPARTAEDVADLVEALRRQTKHGPARLTADLKRLHSITVGRTSHSAPTAATAKTSRDRSAARTRRRRIWRRCGRAPRSTAVR
ncbi:helix-turn-helix domain-containing protein [Streptomyces sp. Inha503]|uniref:helix-turn-helix domain-containing protein n=1 Tax=Streptomyces sp. Inha503 TaxID=3383314 RepID=UPI0039A14B52